MEKVRIYPQLRERYKTVLDKQILWEFLKTEIGSTTISYTKGKRKLLNKQRGMEIKEILDNLDDIMCNSGDVQDIDQDLNLYDNLKKELQTLYERKVLFMSKCRWIEKGQKGQLNIFFNLEKRNYNKKTISELNRTTENSKHRRKVDLASNRIIL